MSIVNCCAFDAPYAVFCLFSCYLLPFLANKDERMLDVTEN